MVKTNKNFWLMGGFGNVLFQVVASKVLLKQGYKVSYIDTLTQRNFITKFLKFSIHENSYSNLYAKGSKKVPNIAKIAIVVFFGFLSKKFNFKNPISTYATDFSGGMFDFQANNIFGYFQDKNFLHQHRREVISLGRELYEQCHIQESGVVVHFRLGDSVWARQNEQYYEKVRELLKSENQRVLIATDSPVEAMQYFSDIPNARLTGAKSSLEDFSYMVSSSKLYCAPSTFSWWAAHAVKEGSVVVIPATLVENLGFYNNSISFNIL